jgi:serine/threonine-protein kinase RsbW
MSTKQSFDLSVEADLENLHQVRDYVDRAGERFGVDSAVLADLRLAVDEAVTNIILHGYNGRAGQVELHMERDGDAVIIRIRDQAESFDASHVNAPQLDTSLADRPFGGMGLFLIKKLTDEAEFLSLPGGGNELKLVKRRAIP